MELVYLWVDKYKNIKDQGFNFSPRFEFEYIQEKNELVLNKENKEYVSIFPENINVTAIVGENGSGKSSLFEALLSILINNEKIYTYLIIVKNKDGDLIQYDSLDVKINYVNKKIKIEKNYNGRIVEDYKSIASLFITNEYVEETIKYYSEQSNTIRTYAEKKNINTKILKNAKKFANVQFIKDAKNFFLPTKARIKIEYFKGLKNLKEEEQKKVEELKKQADEFLEINKYKDYLHVIYEIFEIFKKSNYYSKGSFIQKGIDDNNIYGYNEDLSKKYASLLDKIEKKAFGSNIFYEFTISDIDKKVLNFLKSIDNIHIFKIELLDDNKSFESLSYGERQLLSQLHLILNHFDLKKINTFDHSTWDEQTQQKDEDYENINVEKYFIFIDEFELGLHPNWQKKTLSYMIDFFKMFDIKIDLFITSHSPFILSDIPKENVIFLENGKQKLPFKDNEQTFGANIHTLLSHGFFMKDKGLMGEFAKAKIQDVIYFLNKDEKTKIETKEDAWKIIQIIGEPFLKYKLEEKFHENYSSDKVKNEAKIKRLEEEIERLKSVKPKD
jgi:predicted ATP-dependent endonuclease of OLD family